VISYKNIALQILSYSSQVDYKCYRVIANFVPNFVGMATGVGGRKCDWQHSMAHPRKSLYRRKNLADTYHISRVIANFVPNFVAITTGVGQEKCNWQHSMAQSRNLLPYRPKRKNLAKIFYASQVIANFLPNFVVMATKVNREKMQFLAFNGSSPKTPL